MYNNFPFYVYVYSHRGYNTISSWNVQGYSQGYSHRGYNKFKYARFINKMTKNYIVCLMETHCDPSKVLELPDYKSVHLIRPKSSKSKKISGCLSSFIWYRK
jgi:hypothetical protein